MIPRFAKQAVKTSLGAFGLALHDVRKNNDLQVFLPGHLRALFKRLSINCVIDVGANEGQFARKLRHLGFSGRIVSIEPIREVFERLSSAAASDREWLTWNLACGNKDETGTINVFTQTPFSSFLAPSSNLPEIEGGPIERTETVSVRRLDGLFDEAVQGIRNPCVFLKTDAQGMDFDVIQGAGKSINRIEGIQSEISAIPLYAGAPDYLEFLNYTRDLGFEPTGFFPVLNSPAGGHLIECDVVLIRRHWVDAGNALVESAKH